MAEEEVILSLKIEGADKELRTIQELRDAVSQLEDNLENAEFGSKAFKEAEAELKKANEQLFEFDKRLEGLQDPVKSAEQWVKFGEGVAGAFAAAQGAAVLFGIENENIEKLVARAQGATAIAVGARALAESRLLTVLKESTAGKYASIVAEKAYAIAIGSSTGLLRIFRIVLASTGIGAIAVALGTLVANWDKFSEAIKASIDRLRDFIPGLDRVIKGFETAKKFLIGIAEDLNLVASAEEKEAQRLAEESNNWYAEQAKRAKERDEQRKKEREEEAKRYKERIKLFQEQRDAVNELADEIYAELEKEGGYVSTFLFGRDEAKARAEQEKFLRERMDHFKETLQDLQEDDVEDPEIELGDFFNRRLELIQQGYSNEEALAQATSERILEIEAQRYAARDQLISASLGAIDSLIEASGKNGERARKLQEVLALAQIAYDAGKSISAVVASATAAAAALGPGAPFAIGPYITQGLAVVLPAIASAYAALKKAPDGGGGSAPSVSLPNISSTPQTEQRQGQQTTAQTEFGPGVFKTYVLGSDVSSDLEARQKIEDLASLGG